MIVISIYNKQQPNHTQSQNKVIDILDAVLTEIFQKKFFFYHI